MKSIKLILASAAIMFSITIISCKKKTNSLPPLEIPATQLVIENQSDSDVVVWITLGATPGCLHHVAMIPYVTDSLDSLVGSFTLAAGDSTQAYAPLGLGFNGNLSFNTQPLNCATPQLPNGINIFEFMINNAYQNNGAQETIDISCVAGVNCYIKVYLSGGTPWNAGSTIPVVDSIYNTDLYNNTGLTGVYPFACDVCTGSQSPPVCGDSTIGPCNGQLQSICNVQRIATGSGGIIKVVYMGSAN